MAQTIDRVALLRSLRGFTDEDPNPEDDMAPYDPAPVGQALDPRIPALMQARGVATQGAPKFSTPFEDEQMSSLESGIREASAPKPRRPWASMLQAGLEGLAFGKNAPAITAQRDADSRQALQDKIKRLQDIRQGVSQREGTSIQVERDVANQDFQRQQIEATNRLRKVQESADARANAEAGKAGSPFELWQKQNPNGTVQEWQKLNEKPAPSDQSVSEFEYWAKQNPNAPVSEWLKIKAQGNGAGGSKDFEWVVRGGQPMQIQKGTAKAGDKPYDAVAERKDAGPTGPSPYATERATRTLESVDQLMKKADGWTTGYGSLLANLPATNARNFKAELDTLKANIGFNELTQMREASKTGGALGQVSDRELTLLSAALGALDSGQSTENLKTQLQKIKGSVKRWQKAQEAAMQKPEAGGGEKARYTVDGRSFNIPADQVQEFLKDHPNAKKVGP